MPVKIFVGNLPYATTESEVRRLFRKYEPLHSVVLIADKETGMPVGYGFIELDETVANKAIAEMRNIEFNGRYIRVGRAVGKDPRAAYNAVSVARGGDCSDCVICNLLKKMIRELNAIRTRSANLNDMFDDVESLENENESEDVEWPENEPEDGGSGNDDDDDDRGNVSPKRTVRVRRDPNRGKHWLEKRELFRGGVFEDQGERSAAKEYKRREIRADNGPYKNVGYNEKDSGLGLYRSYRFNRGEPEYIGDGVDQ